jgi:hypothetical protein
MLTPRQSRKPQQYQNYQPFLHHFFGSRTAIHYGLLIIKLSTVRLFSGNGPLAKCDVSSGTFHHKHEAGRFHVRD